MSQKQQVKNKQNVKVITKAQIVLANPVKLKVPALENEDFERLQELLLKAINDSKLSGQAYATSTNINIGLESTLRAINYGKAGCVLLSTNIKPKYVLGLIARNVEVKDAQVPVYVQQDLESVTKNIFEIGALALTLPKNGKGLSEELQRWIEAHLRAKLNKTATAVVANKLKKSKATSKIVSLKNEIKSTEIEEAKNATKPQPSWTGDYISFGNEQAMEIVEPENAQAELQDALSKMIKKAKQKPQAVVEPEAIVDNAAAEQAAFKENPTNDEDDEADAFYGNYAPLTLHKILPNPNRKPRKKRKKNVNKNVKNAKN